MAFSREGFTIDVIIHYIRLTLLNPAILLLLPLTFTNTYLTANNPNPILQQSSTFLTFLRTCQLLALLLWANDFLTTGFANNWTSDTTYDWNREIVLITGGSSGIGARIVHFLLARNRNTTIVIIDYSPLTFTPPPNSKIHFFQGDLSDSSIIRSLSARIKNEVGNPTVLINNAGLVRGATVMDGSYADVEVTIKTNLIAPFLLIKEFLPDMVKNNHGHVMNTGSMSSVLPPAVIADYAATKAGLSALHEALQLELKNIHHAPRVRLTLGLFFFIKTPLIKGEVGMPNFWLPLLHVDSVAESFVDALYSGKGGTIYLPGTMRFIHTLRFLPDWMFRLVRESSREFKIDFKGRQRVDEKTGALANGE